MTAEEVFEEISNKLDQVKGEFTVTISHQDLSSVIKIEIYDDSEEEKINISIETTHAVNPKEGTTINLKELNPEETFLTLLTAEISSLVNDKFSN